MTNIMFKEDCGWNEGIVRKKDVVQEVHFVTVKLSSKEYASLVEEIRAKQAKIKEIKEVVCVKDS